MVPRPNRVAHTISCRTIVSVVWFMHFGGVSAEPAFVVWKHGSVSHKQERIANLRSDADVVNLSKSNWKRDPGKNKIWIRLDLRSCLIFKSKSVRARFRWHRSLEGDWWIGNQLPRLSDPRLGATSFYQRWKRFSSDLPSSELFFVLKIEGLSQANEK